MSEINNFLNTLQNVPSDSFPDDSLEENPSNTNATSTDTSNLTDIHFNKFYIVGKLVNLFLEIEKEEKSPARTKMFILCVVTIAFILLLETGLIIAQGLEVIKLSNVIFLGTIGTITTGIIVLLKIIATSLYNNESDKVLKTVEAIINKL
ncbi:MAG: hypothetical protein ACRDAS_05605 [Cetobacterium sp.]